MIKGTIKSFQVYNHKGNWNYSLLAISANIWATCFQFLTHTILLNSQLLRWKSFTYILYKTSYTRRRPCKQFSPAIKLIK